jgi:IS4 transposase
MDGRVKPTAVRFNFMDLAHDIDSTPVWTFGDDLDAERSNAMRHKNSVFHGLLQHVPWGSFEALVEEHDGGKGVRTLSMRTQFTALAYSQLSGAQSLREIEAALQSHEARLYHLHAKPVKRSTLSDANALRPAAVFTGLFAKLLKQAHRGLRRALAETTYLIDSTSLGLNAKSQEWARFCAGVCGAKAHFVLDADAGLPVFMAITAARVNDISAAKDMPIEAGATYVFDLGYYDYGWWAKLDAAGCRIVTRLKANTPLEIVEENPVTSDGPVLSDRIGYLPARQARSRKNPYGDPVREVCVRMETGKVLRLLSNDLNAGAEEIAALYKRRWEIELFFRWVKQNLKIKSFVGTSENAIRIQIAIALSVYLLLKLAFKAQKGVTALLAFTRLVKANLMQLKRIDRLLSNDPQDSLDTSQMAFECL